MEWNETIQLTNTGKPVAWGEFYGGKIVAVSLHKSVHYTVPLYTHSSPAPDAVKLTASDVIRAAEWFYQWMPKGRVARWIIKRLYSSACLEYFEVTMRNWNHLSRADRYDFIFDLRRSANHD